MNKLFVFTLSIILCAALGCEKKDKVAIRIGKIPITVKEFNEAFEQGRFQFGMELSRKDFLDSLIVRKLILKEAEDLGLDNDPQVLQSLQLFWEQTLLKLALSRKINEVTVPIKVDEEQVRAYYEANKDKDFAGRDFASVQDEIKTLIFREKQKESLQEWTDSLHKKSKIVIDYQSIGIQ